MIVVADSGPLHYLVLLGEIELLRGYGDVRIPAAVERELLSPGAPKPVADWIAHLPEWIRIEAVIGRDPTIGTIDSGEREAIALAFALPAQLILLDDLAARREARRKNLRVTGTLGILLAAAERNLINVPEVIARLNATNFYFDEILIHSLFGRWLE